MEILEVKCSTCNGTGKIITGTDVPVESTCPACGGDGLLNTGTIDNTETIELLNWIKKKIKVILKED